MRPGFWAELRGGGAVGWAEALKHDLRYTNRVFEILFFLLHCFVYINLPSKHGSKLECVVIISVPYSLLPYLSCENFDNFL